MEKNRNHINKDIHYFCKMRPIQSLFGISFTSSSDELEWFECYVDEEGYTRFQMHDFINTFGEYIHVGCEMPCEPTIQIQIDSADK